MNERQRDARGRFCRRTAAHKIDNALACITLALLPLALAWLIAMAQCMEVQQ